MIPSITRRLKLSRSRAFVLMRRRFHLPPDVGADNELLGVLDEDVIVVRRLDAVDIRAVSIGDEALDELEHGTVASVGALDGAFGDEQEGRCLDGPVVNTSGEDLHGGGFWLVLGCCRLPLVFTNAKKYQSRLR